MGNILVTGVGGNVGQYIAEQLSASGYSVVGVYRNKKPQNVKYRLVQSDLADGIPEIEDVTSIIHIAANIDGNVYEQIRDNINATVNLLKFAEDRQTHNFIYTSSVSVYGNVSGELEIDSNIVNPGIYGATKYIAENLVMNANIPYKLVAGLPRMLGPFVNLKNSQHSGFLTLTKKILKGEDVVCYVPYTQYNNYMHVSDLAAFLLVLLQQERSGYEKVLLGAKDKLTMTEILQIMKAAIKSKSQIIIEDKGISPICGLININEAIKIGYAPQSSIIILRQFMREQSIKISKQYRENAEKCC